jgi:hypothetical protein
MLKWIGQWENRCKQVETSTLSEFICKCKENKQFGKVGGDRVRDLERDGDPRVLSLFLRASKISFFFPFSFFNKSLESKGPIGFGSI